MAVPASIFDRAWLIMSLAELGRFAEAAKYEAEAIQDRRANAACLHHRLGAFRRQHAAPHQGRLGEGALRWSSTGSRRFAPEMSPFNFPGRSLPPLGCWRRSAKRSEALNRVQEAEQLLERQAASGIVGHRGWAYHAVGRACLLLGRLDEAQRLAERALDASQRQPGFAAHALHLLGDIATEPDRFDPESGASYISAKRMALAQKHGMRPLVAHCHLGLGKLYRRTGKLEEAGENLASRSDDVPRNGHELLAGTGEADKLRLVLGTGVSEPCWTNFA